MKKYLLVLLFCFYSLVSKSSESDSLMKNLKLSTYFESYYAYDLSTKEVYKHRGFVNHSKNNEIAINLALVKANYNTDNFRANLGLMIGTYSDLNFNSYDDNYKNIYESNVGIKLSAKHNLWLDVGIFNSHIGAETIIGADNWTLTRSLQAEASPYYEAGGKLTYISKNEKWLASIMVLNGWQRIVKSNNFPLSVGTQIQYKPNSKILINSSSFIGNNNSNSKNYLRNRYFHNFYAQVQWNNKLGTIIGFDIGTEESWYVPNTYFRWYSPLFITKYILNKNHYVAARVEYLNDNSYRVLGTSNATGFVGYGTSINYDLQIKNYAMFRIEAKHLNTKKPVFYDIGMFTNNNTTITSALIFYLNK